MTDEEVAKAYTNQFGFGSDCNNISFYAANEAIAQAFYVGYRDGRPKWHDLRKNKNDLPDDERYVWTNVGAGYYDGDGWWDDFGRLQGVIAWCEPKFKEEDDSGISKTEYKNI